MNIDINRVKIFVTVPTQDTDGVREAVVAAGAGVIGNYTHCSTVVKCTGTFKPNANAHPFIGNRNRLEHVEEDKLEFVCGIDNVKRVISALRQAHPYEEPAIDIMPLIDETCFE